MIGIDGELLNLWIAAWFWPFVRILSMLSVAPIYDQKVVSVRLRIGVAGLLALVMAPMLPTPPPIDDVEALGVLLQQIMIGVTMGFAMKIIFTSFQLAGDIIGMQMGLAFAQFIDPAKGTTSPLLGSYLGILASLFFLAMDGHLVVLETILETFKQIPISADLSVMKVENVVVAGAMMFKLGLQVALPVVIALLVCNIIMGVLTKAAPQMNLMSIGFSITILLGILLLSYSVPSIVNNFDGAMTRMLSIAITRD